MVVSLLRIGILISSSNSRLGIPLQFRVIVSSLSFRVIVSPIPFKSSVFQFFPVFISRCPFRVIVSRFPPRLFVFLLLIRSLFLLSLLRHLLTLLHFQSLLYAYSLSFRFLFLIFFLGSLLLLFSFRYLYHLFHFGKLCGLFHLESLFLLFHFVPCFTSSISGICVSPVFRFGPLLFLLYLGYFFVFHFGLRFSIFISIFVPPLSFQVIASRYSFWVIVSPTLPRGL